ncbi:MAG TPA: translocation/assembly module TamB domain-containing protein [Pseudomonadota bacterium]|nr:translocation/assembly module TamB domain-containing protein [Pseudomonadota bacterium]
MLIARSDWGHRQILQVALPLADKALLGKLRVGGLDGDLIHSLAVRDVELRDAEGELVARVERVGVRYNLLALLGRTLHITAVDARGEVHARFLRDGRINFATLTRATAPSSSPLPIDVRVDDINADLAVRYEPAPEPLASPLPPTGAQLHIEGGVRMARDHSLKAELKQLGVEVQQPLIAQLAVQGKVELKGAAVGLQGVKARVRTRGQELASLAPAAQLRGDLELAAQAEGSLELLTAIVDLKLPAGKLHAEAKLQPQTDPLPWELRLTASEIDPSALRAGLPSVQLKLDAQGTGLGPSGRLDLRQLLVAAQDNSVQLSGWVQAPPGLVESRDWQAAQAELKLDVKAPQLGQLAQLGAPTIGGALTGNLGAQLTRRSLYVKTAFTGSKLRAFGVALERLSLQVNTVDMSGEVKLALRELNVAKQRFAELDLAARGRPELLSLRAAGRGPEQVAFRLAVNARPELPHNAPGTGGLTLRGLDADLTELMLARQGKQLALTQPAHIRLNLHDAPIVDVEHLTIGLSGQRVTVAGHYETRGQKLAARLQTRGLDVRQLAKVFDPRSDLPDTKIDLSAQVSGTVKAPVGHVAVNAKIGTSKSLPLPLSSLQATVDLRNQRVSGQLDYKMQPPPGAPMALNPSPSPPPQNAPAPSGPPIAQSAPQAVSAEPAQSAQPGQPGAQPAAKATIGNHETRLIARFDAPITGSGPLSLDTTAQVVLESMQSLLPAEAHSLRGTLALKIVAGGSLQRPELSVRAELPAWQSEFGGGKHTLLTVDYKESRLALQLGTQVVNPEWQQLASVKLDAQAPLAIGANSTAASVMRQLKSGKTSVALDLTGLDLPKSWKAAMGNDAPLRSGTVDAKVNVTGPLLDDARPPVVEVQVKAREVKYALNKDAPEVRGEAGLKLDYRDAQAKLDLDGALDGKPLLTGHAELRAALKELMNGGAAGVKRLPLSGQFAVLPRELPAGLPVRGQVNLKLQVSGTVGEPQGVLDLNTTGLRMEQWAVGDVKAHATLDLKRGVKADLAIAAVSGQPGSLKLTAAVPLPFNLQSPELRAELQAHGYRVDYKPPGQDTQSLAAGGGGVRLVRGTIDGTVKAHGGKGLPVVTAALKLSKGEIAASAVPQVFDDVHLDLQLDENGKISLRKLAVGAEGGHLEASGDAQLDGMALRHANLKLDAQHFPVAAGPIGLWLDTKVEVQGKTQGDTLRGKVMITRTTVTLPKLEEGRSVQSLAPLEDVKLVDARARRAQAAQAKAERKKEQKAEENASAAAGGLPSHTVIMVDLSDPVTVVGPEVRASLVGNIKVAMNGPTNVPVITGEIHSLSGWVQLFKHHYQLSKAQVSLSGETPPNPLLDVQISSQMQDAIIYLGVNGTALKPKLRFTSDPPIYDESQIISLVLSGGRQGGGGLQQKVIGGLSSLLIDKLQSQLAGDLPIDVVRLDLGSGDPLSNSRTSLEIGKYIRDDLFLLYTHRFGESQNILRRTNNNEVTLEWHFFRNYQLDLMGGDQGMGALDLYWLKRF